MEDQFTIKNNCLISPRVNPFAEFEERDYPENITVIDRTNSNGDSCDVYGNIFLDPEIVDDWRWPDSDFLSESSPCIDAGNPESPLDPDSTIADIGPFFFSQPNIAVSIDSLLFTGVSIDERDTTALILRNRGDQRELGYYLDDEVLDEAFWIFDWSSDTSWLEPGESDAWLIEFHPTDERQYLDTLFIWSNDRDQPVIELPIRGVVVNGISFDDGLYTHPTILSLYAFPNPFNASTTIRFSGGLETAATRLTVFDPLGRRIADLTDGKWKMENGMQHSIIWNASNFPTGVYLLQLENSSGVLTHRLILAR